MRLDLLIQATQQAHYDGPCFPLAQLLSPRLQKPCVGVSINVSISSLEKQKTTPIPNCVVGGYRFYGTPYRLKALCPFFPKMIMFWGYRFCGTPYRFKLKAGFKKKYILLVFGTGHIDINIDDRCSWSSYPAGYPAIWLLCYLAIQPVILLSGYNAGIDIDTLKI